jgi:hypothetical protein
MRKIEPAFFRWSRRGRGSLAVGLGLLLGGCSDLLDVEDPQRYTSEDLDESLGAVADGVEGLFHRAIDKFAVSTALLSDEYQNSGTWEMWRDLDEGKIKYADSRSWGAGFDPFEALLYARWFAGDARERFERVLGDTAAANPIMAQVDAVAGLADLYLAQGYCEAPAVPDGPAVSDSELFQQAVTKLTQAIQSAQGANSEEWELVSRAGRARAHLLLGDHDAALADARGIPDGWAYYAKFSGGSFPQYNFVAYFTTRGYNPQAGLRKKWWDWEDGQSRTLLDPYTGEPDSRVPVYFDGSLGQDGATPHYSQWKYQELGADIPVLDSEEMRLIEAEVYWERGDLPGALAILNAVRRNAGLDPLPDSGDPDEVFEYLLHERFAEMFMEGQRMTDLHRFGLVQDMVERGDFVGSEPVRPTKFPLLDDEAKYNPNIEDDVALRCMPMSR